MMTTAIAATLLAGAAAAETHMAEGDLIRTRDITGGVVFSMAERETWDETTRYDAVNETWNDIGEIEDVVLNRSGQMVGIVAEIGGFLDIGDKHVLLPVENVRLVPVDDKTYAVVTDRTEEQLEQLPGVDEAPWN